MSIVRKLSVHNTLPTINLVKLMEIEMEIFSSKDNNHRKY